MAITISQEKKKQRYLLLALALIIFVFLLIIWFGFFQKKEAVLSPLAPAVIYTIPKIEIDWPMLDGLRQQTRQPFEGISAFKGDFGRKNPFVPY